MRHWTFGTQMGMGLGILAAGNLLAFLTRWGLLANLGCFLYGLLFLLHPVWPGPSAANPRTMQRVCRICGGVLMGWAVLTWFCL